ncbi:MAG TPA: prepilin-type N-terminal cleavage/methylation domain-containing protein [Ectothiorhodospiraceae bacterium]|nr:prepilin-type N-terminal cleavage/methylation domain-containing protein [Ectothiorhodospiraceae bacterium]
MKVNSIRLYINGFTLVELILAVAVLSILTAIAYPSYNAIIEEQKTNQAIADISSLGLLLENFFYQKGRLPNDLQGFGDQIDPWGNEYQYLNISLAKGKGGLRKDHKLVPINTDFDLYSMGPDGESVPPLTAKMSKDDIVRANNGSYIGKAEDY